MGWVNWLWAAAVALAFSEVGRAVMRSDKMRGVVWWQGAAVVVAAVAAGGLLSGAFGGGVAWFLAAAALGGLLAGWAESWRAVLIMAAAGGALLWARLLPGVALGLLVVVVAWVPGALVGWVLRWQSWRAGPLGVFGAVCALVLAVVLLGPGKTEPLPAVAAAPVAPVVAGLCPCDAGLVCTGPRGGRYCITAAGGKKYL